MYGDILQRVDVALSIQDTKSIEELDRKSYCTDRVPHRRAAHQIGNTLNGQRRSREANASGVRQVLVLVKPLEHLVVLPPVRIVRRLAVTVVVLLLPVSVVLQDQLLGRRSRPHDVAEALIGLQHRPLPLQSPELAPQSRPARVAIRVAARAVTAAQQLRQRLVAAAAEPPLKPLLRTEQESRVEPRVQQLRPLRSVAGPPRSQQRPLVRMKVQQPHVPDVPKPVEPGVEQRLGLAGPLSQ